MNIEESIVSPNKKLISIVIPCYNDHASVSLLYERLMKVFSGQLPAYACELTYCDDCSPDDGQTWAEIKKLCAKDPRVRGVRNAQNFGIYRNQFAAMRYGRGDATMMQFGDLQDPPEKLPEMVALWEQGHKVVIGIRRNQYYSPILMFLRGKYYGLMKKLAGRRTIVGANGFGLYDRGFVDVLREFDDPQPTLLGAATEYGSNIATIESFLEKGGREGRSNLNFWGKYDAAMVGVTSYTKMLLRLIVFVGLAIGGLAVLWALWIFILKLTHWDSYPVGIPALTVGMFFLGGVQLTFLGIIGEYVLAINNRSMKRPLTAVQETINFGGETNENS
jgi:glycosyltransferase involved in cell wall biosynthesis